MDIHDEKRNGREGLPGAVLRGALIGTAAGVALVALSAFILMKQWLGAESIPYLNAGVKVIAAGIAALCAVRRSESGNILKGAAASGLYMLLSFIVFSLISGEFGFNTGLLFDMAMCLLTGAIVGIVKNLRR